MVLNKPGEGSLPARPEEVPLEQRLRDPLAAIELTDQEFARFQEYIYSAAGIRVADHKRTLVSNRIRRRLRATGTPNFATYYRHLTSPGGASELPHFLDEITTNETYFFRDKHQYAWLTTDYLGELAREVAAGKRKPKLKLWSAACSTGAEPYSMSIAVHEAISNLKTWEVKILATDLSGAVLDKAKDGSYDARAVQMLSDGQRRRFFRHDKAEERWQITDELKKIVEFRRHNLLETINGGPFDCIFIKNVLIYFDDASKQKVVGHLLGALARGGYLVVGPAEGIFRMLDPLERKNAWLYRKPL